MLNKLLFLGHRKPKRDTLRDLDRERHFETLYMQSFTEMRARNPKAQHAIPG
ncbi:hypothetical protein N6L26_01830 [Qipengyuania sp. SS22]|uniref:hypothetical protein n=1 Tax=Qipengyuania sp. SS22 TaxID=2979461 RepID=UPI0021E53789|nr:hypothetical protein [Qipengyuania sp. SS22]UYH55331.1 hypothetical protein N6L26_01830 [Qipengyuania sp. SS22]